MSEDSEVGSLRTALMLALYELGPAKEDLSSGFDVETVRKHIEVFCRKAQSDCGYDSVEKELETMREDGIVTENHGMWSLHRKRIIYAKNFRWPKESGQSDPPAAH